MLGKPLGHSEYIDAQLLHINVEHQILLISPMCKAHGCCFFSARHPADATREFAAHHGKGVRLCLRRLLGAVFPDGEWNLATILFDFGCLGSRSAIKGRRAVFFASWADGLEMISKRHPFVADLILNDLTQDRPYHNLSAQVRANDKLANVYPRPPSWAALAEGEKPRGGPFED